MQRPSRLTKRILLFLVYALLAVTFTVLLSQSMDHHYDFFIHERLIFEGSVFTAARILSPAIVGVLVQTGLQERMAAFVYAAAAITLLLYMFARLLETWSGMGRDKSMMLAPFILVPMVWNYILLSSIYYLDDIPAILLFTLGLIALAEKKSFRFHIIFFLAVINRETAVFLIPAMFLLQIRRRNISSLLIHSVILAVAVFGIRLLIINLISAANSSSVSMFQNHFIINVQFLLSVFRGNPEALKMIMTFGGLWLLLPFCFGKVEQRVMLMTVLFPIFFIGMAITGNLNGEARIFNEMIPVVTAPCILLLARRIKKGASAGARTT